MEPCLRSIDLASVVVTCEHATNRVPAEYREHFRGASRALQSHRGVDFGAFEIARAIAVALKRQVIAAEATRLLVDLNRSVGHRALFSRYTRDLPAALREEILCRFYQPYRDEVLAAIRGCEKKPVLHLSIHSFAPRLGGEIRKADIGLLYDPGRPLELELCKCWQSALRERLPGFAVRRNSPYRGRADGLATALRKELPARSYLGIEIELNQKHVREPGGHRAHLAQALQSTLRELIAVGLGTATSGAEIRYARRR